MPETPHQELMDYCEKIQEYLDSGWPLWSAMKRVLLPVLEERNELRRKRDEAEDFIHFHEPPV